MSKFFDSIFHHSLIERFMFFVLGLRLCRGSETLSNMWREGIIRVFFGADQLSTGTSTYFVFGFLQLSSFPGCTNTASQYLGSPRVEVPCLSGLINSRSREFRVLANVLLKREPMNSNLDTEGSEC